MWYVRVTPRRYHYYSEKWRGYACPSEFAELAKFQKEVREKHSDLIIPKCIVRTREGLAWRYLHDDNTYSYRRITKSIPQDVFKKYYIQYIYASKVRFEAR